MKIDDIMAETGRTSSKLGHVQALLDALGDPSKWTYTGTCADAGPDSKEKCACGHPIRFCFILTNEGNQAQVGSTCIETVGQVNPALGATLREAQDRLEKELAEAIKVARKARQTEENTRLWEEYCAKRDSAIARHRQNRNSGLRSPFNLWFFAESHRETLRAFRQPEYQKPALLAKWLKRAIAHVDFVIQ